MEPVTISVEKQNLPTQARSPTHKETTVESREHTEPKKELEPSRLKALLEDVGKDLKKLHNVDLQFSVHKPSGKIMVTVIDGSSGEILRELPPSEILDIAARVDIMLGLIFDQKG